MWRNTENTYGLTSIGLHWLVAAMVIGLFTLGLWMGSLDYYHPWYYRAPEWHKGIGVLLFPVTIGHAAWRYINPRPAPAGTVFEQKLARAVHALLYMLLLATMLSGYLMATADGRALDVFGWFGIPALPGGFDSQEDIAGEVHELLAFTLIGLTILHGLAALKHHFIDRDATLKRMLGIRHGF